MERTYRDVTELARAEGQDIRAVRQGLALAFIAPEIITAILDGTIAPDVSVAMMSQLPSNWLEQRRRVGLA